MTAVRAEAEIVDASQGRERNSITVCLFISQLAIGGAELQLASLALALRRAGFGVIVTTLEDRGDFASRFRSEGLEVIVLPRRWPLGVDAIWALARLVAVRHVHLVHAWLWSANWRAAAARLLAPRVPVIASIRSLEDDLGRVHLWLYRLLSPLTSSVIVNSVAVLERSVSRSGIPRHKYHVVPNVVDIARLDVESTASPPDIPIPGRVPFAIYVGSLEPRKRVVSLARIAALVRRRHDDFRVVVVGDGSERPRLEDNCAREDVSDRFLLVGYQDRVAPWLGRARVLVHPSRNEGCCNAILEAMALGVPVVAYRVGGNSEIVSDGVTGYLVDDGDETAMADRVSELLARPDLAKRMGESGRDRIRRDFSSDAMFRRTVEAYRDALRGRDRARGTTR